MAIITTIDQLKAAISAINHDLDINSFSSFLSDARLNNIIPAIGNETYALLSGNSLNANQTAALLLLQKAEANFALSYYVNFGSIQISEQGLHVLQDDKKKIASDKKIEALRKQCMNDGFIALEAAIDFIEANLTDFVAYTASD